MAYGLKYYHDFCDLEGKPQRIAILENEYEGLAQAVRAAPDPFQKTYESGSDFKFDPRRPSKATVTLLYELDFQFSEIWNADERTFKVEKYHDNSLEWVGFIIPNGFRRLMMAGKKYIQIDASDGLSTLKSIPFLQQDGNTYGTSDLVYNGGLWFPFSLIATEILRKLDLDINTWIAVDVYEQSMVKVGEREADPLSQAIVNVKTYINEKTEERIPYWRDAGAVWDCERVLDNLLKIWGAKLYQEGGVWRIKRVNLDANKTGKEWRIYNTLNVFIGQQTIEPDLTIPCNSMYDVLVGVDHTVNMDRVFEAVRINYTYAYERDAEESNNMISNGNFAQQGSNSPIGWSRWGRDDTPPLDLYYVTLDGGVYTDGINTGISISHGADQRRELQYGGDLPVNVGDEIHLEWWERIDQGVSGGRFTGVYTIYLETSSSPSASRDSRPDTKRFFLGNNGIDKSNIRGQDSIQQVALHGQWTEERVYFFSYPQLIKREESYIANNFWAKIVITVPEIPDNGTLRIRAHGVAEVSPYYQFQIYRRQPFYGWFPSGTEWTLGEDFYTGPDNAHREMTLTGFFMGIAKDTSEELTSSDHNYTVFNDGEYTDRFEPIEIFNGDADDPNHVSRIRVLSAEPNKQVWNTYEDAYTPSSLGLITAYSIMNQYNRPYKMIEGTFALRGIQFGSVVKFSSLPGEKFIVQRGTFSDYSRYGNFTGTLVQLVADLPLDGGLDNGNTVEPNWINTGRTRCYKTSRGGTNTGYVETEQVDINPSSPTANNTRWILSETQDLITCPLGEPSDYWFGVDGVVLDTNNLDYFPVGKDGNGITVTFNNPGGGYLYFLHRVELGVIESVYTPVQDEIVDDWQYFADEVIGGYTYRVFRLNHPTGIFKNGVVTFVFNS